MIDIGKYEGHTEGPWKPHMIQPLYGNMVLFGFNEQDALLASDAPKLLEEVKRLRERLEAFDCMRFDIEHAIDHSWASWEDLKVFLKEMIE